jgi:hypothetical protein
MAMVYPGSLKAERAELYVHDVVYVIVEALSTNSGQRVLELHPDGELRQRQYIASKAGWVHP